MVRQAAYVLEPRFEKSRFPPRVRGPRLIQSAWLAYDPVGYLSRQRERLGPVFTLRVLPNRAGLVCAADAATNRAVLTDQQRFAAGDAAGLIEPIVGPHSLLVTPPPAHLRNRKLLLPPFHGQRLDGWTTRIHDLVQQQLPELATGKKVAVRPWAQRLTLEVILRVVFGLTDRDQSAEIRRMINRLMDPRIKVLVALAPAIRRHWPRLSPDRIVDARRAALDRLLLRAIALRRSQSSEKRHDDVLSALLTARDEDGSGFSDPQLCDELTGLVLAGHETTATALAWTLHLLAHHSSVRDALISDLDNRQDTMLRAVIKESLRLRPPVIDAIRTAAEDTELGGQPVPKHAFVSALFPITHLDPDLWSDPLAFKPERHLTQEPAPYSLTPFGGGVRRCLGASLAQLELEVTLRAVLQDHLPEPAGRPEAIRLDGVTLVPARGGRIILQPRPRSRPRSQHAGRSQTESRTGR